MVPERQALPAIAGYSIEENAAIAVNYLTAWVALMEMARLRPTDRVLITAAAGGVGTAAVQIATRFGCATVGLAGSDAKLEAIRALGAESAVNYRRTDFEERLRAAAGRDRFDVVLEVVGGEVFRAVWPASHRSAGWWWPGSRASRCSDGTRSPGSAPGAISQGRHPVPRAGIARPSGDAYRLPAGRPAAPRAGLGALMAFVTTHGIRPVVGATFPSRRWGRRIDSWSRGGAWGRSSCSALSAVPKLNHTVVESTPISVPLRRQMG